MPLEVTGTDVPRSERRDLETKGRVQQIVSLTDDASRTLLRIRYFPPSAWEKCHGLAPMPLEIACRLS
jgi:hypothetical protein